MVPGDGGNLNLNLNSRYKKKSSLWYHKEALIHKYFRSEMNYCIDRQNWNYGI